MKSLFFYLFGIITALYAFVIMFNLYAPELMDDYWLDYVAIHYPDLWYYGSLTTAIVFILFLIIFVYNLEKGTNHEKREPLLIKSKEEENE